MGAARVVGIERLGQQLFPVAGFAQGWIWGAAIYRIRLGAGSGIRHRHSEFGNGRLGVNSFSQDGAGAGRWAAICEKLARKEAATGYHAWRSSSANRSSI